MVQDIIFACKLIIVSLSSNPVQLQTKLLPASWTCAREFMFFHLVPDGNVIKRLAAKFKSVRLGYCEKNEFGMLFNRL